MSAAAKANLVKVQPGEPCASPAPLTEQTAFMHASSVDAKFWRDVHSGLWIIVRAIYRRWIGGELRCKHCKQVL